MNSRNLPWIFLGLAVVLAVVAIARSGFEPYHETHPHDSFSHVNDAYEWHISDAVKPGEEEPLTISLPYFGMFGKRKDLPIGISKFMIMEVIAAALIVLIYLPMGRRLASGAPPHGAWDNTFDSVLVFIRDEVAKPNIGEHDADKYVPFLWTLFLFVLINNLLGMIPWLGSPTSNLYATGALAVVAFVMMHGAAMVKMGFVNYWKSTWPHIDVPFGMGYVLKPMIFVIEMVGTVIKSGVLAVRLFANMFAGHTVLAMILGFIVMAGNAAPLLWTSITTASVLGVAALSLLELFVAFLQAYIFVFLTSLFMGMALHPAH
jgi:F-type H+-transporting ATPase subunit a